MPIDSICVGCGKTLRVNEEFVGRKARCPVCGMVYVAGHTSETPSDPRQSEPRSSESSPSSSNPADVETVYAQKVPSNSPMDQQSDSWSALPTAKPLDPLIPRQGTTASATNPMTTSVSDSASTEGLTPPVAKYMVRTPNSMVYGPSTAETVHKWIEEGRLDDSCHIRDETSDQWLGIPAWKFQSRKQSNPMSIPGNLPTNQFGDIPVSTVQSVGYSKAGNGGLVLILGLISWILCPTFIGAIVCGILAIVFAVTELKKIKNGQSPSKEKSLVLIGLLLAVANLATWCIAIVGLIVVAILNP
jgi:hypothetical protein